MRTPWQLLRVKTDEDAADTDWVGTNAALTAADCAHVNPVMAPDVAITGVEVFVLGTDEAGAPVARASSVFDLTLVESVPRNVGTGTTSTWSVALVESSVEAACALQTVYYFPINGADLFTFRISNQTIDAAITRLQVWWRPVAR